MRVQGQTVVPHYRFLTDLGHGWLEVPEQEIRALGIEGELTAASKKNRDAVYLDDEHDAQIFIHAKQKQGQRLRIVPMHEQRSEVNNFPRYGFYQKAT